MAQQEQFILTLIQTKLPKDSNLPPMVRITDKKNKEIDPITKQQVPKVIDYERNDIMGILALLNRFESTKHTMDDMKGCIKLKDKILKDFDESNLPPEIKIELTLNEVSFLKLYINEFMEREGKVNPLNEFEMRTIVMLEESFKS